MLGQSPYFSAFFVAYIRTPIKQQNMETSITTPPNNISYSNAAVKTIAWLGLLAGTLDICAAFLSAYIQRGTPPEMILRGIASAVFGKEAMTGGPIMIFYGLIFHFIIAYSCTIV